MDVLLKFFFLSEAGAKLSHLCETNETFCRRPDQISWNLLYFDFGVGVEKGEQECLDCFCSVFNILRQLTQPPTFCTHSHICNHRWVKEKKPSLTSTHNHLRYWFDPYAFASFEEHPIKAVIQILHKCTHITGGEYACFCTQTPRCSCA